MSERLTDAVDDWLTGLESVGLTVDQVLAKPGWDKDPRLHKGIRHALSRLDTLEREAAAVREAIARAGWHHADEDHNGEPISPAEDIEVGYEAYQFLAHAKDAIVVERDSLRAALAEKDRQIAELTKRRAEKPDASCGDCRYCVEPDDLIPGCADPLYTTVRTLKDKLQAAERELAEARAHEQQTHDRLGAILGTDDSLEECAKRVVAQRDEARGRITALVAERQHAYQLRDEARAERDRLKEEVDEVHESLDRGGIAGLRPLRYRIGLMFARVADREEDTKRAESALAQAHAALRADTPDGEECQRCHRLMLTRSGQDPTPECDQCAHVLIAELRTLLAAAPGDEEGGRGK